VTVTVNAGGVTTQNFTLQRKECGPKRGMP
jgi:hypothetical protein